MNKEDALEIQAADKIMCDHEDLDFCNDKCSRRVAHEKLECRFEDGYHSLSARAEGYLDAVKHLGTEKNSDSECPTCGNKDIQSAELLEAWKKIEELEKYIEKFQDLPAIQALKNAESGAKAAIKTPPIDWKDRYDQIKAAYIKTRLEVSGSFGNWDYATRKRVLENEVSKELGFVV